MMSANLPVIILAATLMGISWTALAQTGAASAAGLDQRTERREVYPGCSVMVRPDNKTQIRYIGGSCVGGLLQGIVRVETGDRLGLIQFQGGKELRQVSWKVPTAGSYPSFSTIVSDENGKLIGGASCNGKTADERANSHPRCLEAVRIFGENALNGSAMSGDQPMVGAGSDASANTGGSLRDDPKELGGGYKP